jgi:hypothetical protein
VTSDIIRVAAGAAWAGMLWLADRRLMLECGSKPGLCDRIPGWYALVVVSAMIALMIAAGVATLAERR